MVIKMSKETAQVQERLDITEIKTVEDINATDFSKYVDKPSSSWVKYVVYPVASKVLDDLCKLSTKEGSTVKLGWSMGDLYYSNK